MFPANFGTQIAIVAEFSELVCLCGAVSATIEKLGQ
jgi:hypothetical protein